MAAHNEQSSNYSSPSNSVFYNNNYSSPESPTSSISRKRKQQQHQQQDFQSYGDQSNGVLENIYQTYNQPWNSQNNVHQDYILPITTTSSSSTTTTTTYHQHEDSSLTWHRPSNSHTTTDDPFLVTTNYNQQDHQYMNHSSQKPNGGVGENTEIHNILNLDQPSSFQFMDTKENNTRTLHLNDLGNQRLIHQSWSPQQQYATGANSPGFFTPGFLESLQEDDESPQSFPFHVLPVRNWEDENQTKSDTIVVSFYLIHSFFFVCKY